MGKANAARKKAVVYLTTAHHINMRTGQTVCKVRESIPEKKNSTKVTSKCHKKFAIGHTGCATKHMCTYTNH